MRNVFTSLAVLLALQLPLGAQITVDYPDSTLVASPQGQYPIYTPTNGNVVRAQVFCPASFAGLPTQPMQCTKVGVQIAGQEAYTVFVIRAGKSTITSLSSTWATNLPDQTIQSDQSGTILQGGLSGSTQVNQWVEYDLASPFDWSPGEAIVLDITAQSAVAGTYCRTAIGGGPRVYNTSYTGQGTGSVLTSGGIKFRMVFDHLGVERFGTGCADATGAPLAMTFANAPRPGWTFELGTSSSATPYFLAFGLSDQLWLGLQLPLDLTPFGTNGCYLYTSQEGIFGTFPAGNRLALPLPPNPTLVGAVSFWQGFVFDVAIPSALPLASSDMLKVTVTQ